MVDFSKIRKCKKGGGVLEITKTAADSHTIIEYYGEEIKELYRITCHHGKYSTSFIGRTLEEAVGNWNEGRDCSKVLTEEWIKEIERHKR